MEMRKVLRKATAVAASASFIGATMLGAVAQNLAEYPKPFVKDGTFDAFIVVGADAQPEDVIGAVDVGSSLQFALKKATTVSGGASEATIDEGVKVQKTGNAFNYEDSINTVEGSTQLTEDDLPSTLADGKYVESEGANKNSETYTQKLFFNDNQTAKLIVAQDDDVAEKAGDYLFIDKGRELYNYTLEFDSAVEYDNSTSTTTNDDFKTSTLTIQGKTYTITEVTRSGGVINKITLLSGEAVLWLTQNNPITKTVSGVEHTVEVLDVTEDADACQVKVDDQTVIIDVDETKTISGVQLGITDVRAIHAQLQDVDVCQVSIGASEVKLEDGKKVKVDDVDLDGSEAFLHEGTPGEFEGFSVTYDAADLDDDIYLSSGKEFIDPVFNGWKIVYGGLTADYETYAFKSSSTNADFKFLNNDGKEVTIPFFMNDSNNRVIPGDGNDVDEVMLVSGGVHSNGTAIFGLSIRGNPNGIGAGYANNKTVAVSRYRICRATDVTDCEGIKILASTSNGEAHVFQIDNINVDDNQTDITDITYGREYKDVSYTDGRATNLDLGSFGSISVNISEIDDDITVMQSLYSKIETNAQGSLRLTLDSVNATVFVDETDRSANADVAEELESSNVSVRASPDSTDEEIDLFSLLLEPNQNLAGDHTGLIDSYETIDLEDSSDYDLSVSLVGTRVTTNNEDDNSVVIEFPKAEVYGNVFVAPIVATVSTAASGIPTYTLSKLNVGSAKLDSEISDVGANNLIVVGGPCANKVSAQVLGKTFPACGADSGIAAGTAVIKAVAQSSGNVALVVAGYDAVDTRRATRVLANYDQYALSGSEVTVTGTSLTDIQVKKSA
jgi:hypothetical protein